LFQKELYNGIPNVETFTLKGVQTIHRSTPETCSSSVKDAKLIEEPEQKLQVLFCC
jgi:hypothetical protein